MKIEIDVLNYNGAELLKKCLPSVQEAARNSSYQCKLVVVDNCSTDESESLVRNSFKRFEFYKTRENKVLCSFNEVAAGSDADIVFFMNNDLIVDKHFIDPLIDIHKKKDNVFLAAARVYNFDGTEIEEGVTKPIVQWGIVKGISKYRDYEKDLDAISCTLQAGFGAFDRKKFLAIGGYDTLYLPGILEDTDLGFRAWRNGYRSYYQPKSHIYHIGKASFAKRFGSKKLLAISHRNTYCFVWKNIRDKKILFSNAFFILPRMIYAFLTLKWEIVWGIFWFLQRLPLVLKARSQSIKNDCVIKKDKEVFATFN